MTTGEVADRQDLAGLGYKQELARPLGRFSSFAAGFSYLSVLTGTFQLFYLGYNAGGPAFWWTWPLTFLGQLLVALCFAEVASHYPLAGGVYQWAKLVGSPALGWLTGWVYLACLVVTVAAVALAVQVTLPKIDPAFQLLSNPTNNAVLLACVVIALTTLLNSIGVRWLARVNNVGVFAELLGALTLIALLFCHARRGPEVVLVTQGKGAGEPGGYLVPFLAAALMASYVMFGFDSAGLLCEETRSPRRTAPRAILQALTAVSVVGGLMLLAALMAAADLHDPALGDVDGGLQIIVQNTLGKRLGNVFLADVVIAVTVCALTVQTGAVRLIFAMARDNNLPFSRALSRVSTGSHTPVAPAVLTGLLAALILVVNLDYSKVIDAIVPVSVIWANLAYLLVTASLLVRRLRGWPARGGSSAREVFTLGRWGLPINAGAVLFGVFVIVNMSWPRPDAETTWEDKAALIFTAAMLIPGVLYYALVQRRRTQVLPEHRAT